MFASSLLLRHGTATIISRLPVVVSHTPFRFPATTSPVVALMPKYTPSSHMHVNYPSGPPARLLFHKIPSANDKPCTFSFSLSLTRCFAVATDFATLSTRIQLFQRSTALELPTGLFSMIILIALSVLQDSIKLVSTGSSSHFPLIFTKSNPISRSHAISLRHIHSPVDFFGATLLSTGLVALSLATRKRQRLPFLLVARERVVQMDFWVLPLFFSCFKTVLLSPLPLMQCLHQLRNGRCVISYSILWCSLGCRGSCSLSSSTCWFTLGLKTGFRSFVFGSSNFSVFAVLGPA